MAKAFGIVSADSTALTAIGTIRTLKTTQKGHINYSRNAAGAPDGDSGVIADPSEATCTMERDGNDPALGAAFTLNGITFEVTEVSDAFESGEAQVVELSLGQAI